jgi:putative transposase
MDRFLDRYRIGSARLQKWDYRWKGAYFITICTQGRECYFGDVVDGKMKLSGIGIIADILWYEISNHAKNFELGEFVVMPNHVHGVLILNGNDNSKTNNIVNEGVGKNVGDGAIVKTLHATSLQSTQQIDETLQPPPKNKFMSDISPKSGSVSTIIRLYKSAVSKHARRLGFVFAWQERFYDNIIRDKQSFQTISEYIVNNPGKWEDDRFHLNDSDGNK